MFTERMKRIGRKNLRLNKNDKEFIKWETVDNVETILLTYNTHCFKSRFFQKFKKFLGKKFDKARVEIKTFEEIYKT